MKTTQLILGPGADIERALQALDGGGRSDLVLAFGAPAFLSSHALNAALRRRFPHAAIAGCSSGGEIAAERGYDDSCVITAIEFERTTVAVRATRIDGMDDSWLAGARLAALLPRPAPAAVLLFGTGVAINGSALIAGLQSVLPGVPIAGALASDGVFFKQTWTLGPDGPASDQIVVVGLYGSALRVAQGCAAGWSPFGLIRRVTRCSGNVLYQLDGKRALDIYKTYLGRHAAGLPASGVLFPFEMLDAERRGLDVFRTILGVDEREGSLILAGDLDPDGYLRLMHATNDDLVEGAALAARQALAAASADGRGDALALMVSCIGRKLMMGDGSDEEIEAAAAVLGGRATVAGFYANGEIAGTGPRGGGRLHNQTMVITWLRETA